MGLLQPSLFAKSLVFKIIGVISSKVGMLSESLFNSLDELLCEVSGALSGGSFDKSSDGIASWATILLSSLLSSSLSNSLREASISLLRANT